MLSINPPKESWPAALIASGMLFIGLSVMNIVDTLPSGTLRQIEGTAGFVEIGNGIFPAIESAQGAAICTRSACKGTGWKRLQGKPAVAEVDANGQMFRLTVAGVDEFTLEDVARNRSNTITVGLIALGVMLGGIAWLVQILRSKGGLRR